MLTPLQMESIILSLQQRVAALEAIVLHAPQAQTVSTNMDETPVVDEEGQLDGG